VAFVHAETSPGAVQTWRFVVVTDRDVMAQLATVWQAARDAVLQSKRIVQVGTQHRSEPHPQVAHDLVQSGALGQVSKVEVVWNYHGPRWRGREEVKQIREADTDWHK